MGVTSTSQHFFKNERPAFNSHPWSSSASWAQPTMCVHHESSSPLPPYKNLGLPRLLYSLIVFSYLPVLFPNLDCKLFEGKKRLIHLFTLHAVAHLIPVNNLNFYQVFKGESSLSLRTICHLLTTFSHLVFCKTCDLFTTLQIYKLKPREFVTLVYP